MNEGLVYTDDDQSSVEGVATEWQLEHTVSNTSINSQLYLQFMNYHLHLIHKLEPSLERRVIPATPLQRLAFYRMYAASPNKTRSMTTGYQSNSFFWLYLFNVIFKTLPQTYIQMFLASYAPKHHLYLHKMSPLFLGTKFIILLVSFFEILFYANNMLFLFECAFTSIVWKNPWNRCPPDGFIYESENVTIQCYTITELEEKLKNESVFFDPNATSYITKTSEIFHVAEIGYMIHRIYHTEEVLSDLYCLILLMFTSIFCRLIYKKTFWKILTGAHLAMLVGEVLVFLHLFFFYKSKEFRVINVEHIPSSESSIAVLHADVDILLETASIPPIIHVLTARSMQEISPTRDSAVIIISNTIFYLFRGLLTHRLKMHCESLISLPLYPQATAYMGWIFLWPMYLSTFTFGELFTIIFYNMQFFIEFSNLVIIFACLIEIIKSEWVWLNRIFLTIVLTIAGVILNYAMVDQTILALSMIGKLSVITLECFILTVMYPLPRFIDDIIFHYGTRPYKLRILSLKLVPVISALIVYICIEVIVRKVSWSGVNKMELSNYWWLLPVLFTPLALGMIYSCLSQKLKNKREWTKLFKPEGDWGPHDSTIKDIRKEYDSRVYIASQAPRNICRYMSSKAESKFYELDICYSRKTPLPASEYRRDK